MKRFLPIVSLILAGCQAGPQLTLYKAGSLPAERQAAYDTCKIASFRDIPQSMVTEYTPGYRDPGILQCDVDGTSTSCWTVGAFDMPPRAISRDVNAALRARAVERCLNAGGYQLLRLPPCKAAERQSLLARPQPENARQMTCRADNGPLE